MLLLCVIPGIEGRTELVEGVHDRMQLFANQNWPCIINLALHHILLSRAINFIIRYMSCVLSPPPLRQHHTIIHCNERSVTG